LDTTKIFANKLAEKDNSFLNDNKEKYYPQCLEYNFERTKWYW